MGKHKSILVTEKGGRNVLRSINVLKTITIPDRCNDLVYLVAENIKKVAQPIYDTFTEYDGDLSRVFVDAYFGTYKGTFTRSAEVIAHGDKVGFIEFGTGVCNDVYPRGIFENYSMHGTYGQGKGNNEAWGFYGDRAGNPNSFVVTKPNGKTLVVSYGNQPARALYRGVKETQKIIYQLALKSRAKTGKYYD